jgi:hypothetical protein
MGAFADGPPSAPKGRAAHGPPHPPIQEHPAMSSQDPDQGGWKWRYSFLGGIMYGPIPVGLIVLVVLLLVYFLFFYR